MTSTHQLLTLRALVSTKDAGVIIGKQGKNVAQLLERANVKANVSNVIPGVNDRVVTVTGGIEHVALAYAFIAQTLLDNARPADPAPSADDAAAAAATPATLRLLISHFLMGSVIGRQGIKIKLIQEMSGCHMTATKDMLPESTERVVEVRGVPESIRLAVFEIGKCLMEDWERGVGTVLYNPAVRLNLHHVPPQHAGYLPHPRDAYPARGPPAHMVPGAGAGPGAAAAAAGYGGGGAGTPLGDPADFTVEQIAIPADMVGCIIGRGGARIGEIRRSSGARIAIAKHTNEETGRRLFTITGLPENNERAIAMLYGQLEAERERREAGEMGGGYNGVEERREFEERGMAGAGGGHAHF
eukprot:CAMPEP_0198308630 /NCGR_PEP_ID=MMETSP1450-20131203/1235_1 /TAXON_ID=753684 ORGANISM="Madagascaria erythrocladiodes, Strain CCMP3234" /NCGR_SAMPLE_ID=MMETSP1450 /ASSEMBLY_ACC=CAM_ASM_001115 /LENGTH=356 /DNA_ID=CAMNT_0044011315 /DNA_START=87 /DNA_END=1157 /DNA_ORIENTATION=-